MVAHPSLAVNILIIVGESAWVIGDTFQLRKLIKTHDTRGLSALTQTLNTAGTVGWATYFALNHLWFPFVTNILFFMVGTAILGYILFDKKKFLKGLAAILIIGPITSYVLFHMPEAAGWLGMSYNWIAATPRLVKVVRIKKVSGIAEKTFYFDICAIVCTLTYAAIIHSEPLIAGCVQGLVYTAIVMRYYYHYRNIKGR